MNSGFLLAGIGFIAFAIFTYSRRLSRVGSVLLFLDGIVLCMNAFLTTDPEGATPHTLHGLIHGAIGGIFFFTMPVAMLLVSRRLGRTVLLLTGIGIIIGVASFIISDVFSLNASGLAERIVLLVFFSWIISNSLMAQSMFGSNPKLQSFAVKEEAEFHEL
jgi:hypothetical membrane protein